MARAQGLRDLAAQLISETRVRLESKRRAFGFRGKPAIIKPKPFVERNDKRFDALFADYKLLYAEGRVRWGVIVQANTLLFGSKAPIAPACMVYADTDSSDGAVTELFDFAHWLFQLKGASGVTDEFLLRIKRLLEDEFEAPMNVQIPEQFGSAGPTLFTTIVVFPDQLPAPRLVFSWFPVLVLPEKTAAAMILPEKYWSRGLAGIWRRR
jgi:hypothetical protein